MEGIDIEVKSEYTESVGTGRRQKNGVHPNERRASGENDEADGEEEEEAEEEEEEEEEYGTLVSTVASWDDSLQTFLDGKSYNPFGVRPHIKLEIADDRMLRMYVLLGWAAILTFFLLSREGAGLRWNCNDFCGNTCSPDDGPSTAMWEETAAQLPTCGVSFSPGTVTWNTVNDLTAYNYDSLVAVGLYVEGLAVSSVTYTAHVEVVRGGSKTTSYSKEVTIHCSDPVDGWCSWNLVFGMAIGGAQGKWNYTVTFEAADEVGRQLLGRLHALTLVGKESYTIVEAVIRICLLCGCIFYLLPYFVWKNISPQHHIGGWMPEQVWLEVLLVASVGYLNPMYLPGLWSREDDSVTAQAFTTFEALFPRIFSTILFALVLTILMCIMGSHQRCLWIALPPSLGRGGVYIPSVVAAVVTILFIVVDVVDFVDKDYHRYPVPGTGLMQGQRAEGSATLRHDTSKATGLIEMMLTYGWWCVMAVLTVGCRLVLMRKQFSVVRTHMLCFRIFLLLTLPIVLASSWWRYYSYENQTSLYPLTNSTPDSVEVLMLHSLLVLLLGQCYMPVYTPRNASPPPPQSRSWITWKWSGDWVAWREHYGQSLYFFLTEEEREAYSAAQAKTIDEVVQDITECMVEQSYSNVDGRPLDPPTVGKGKNQRAAVRNFQHFLKAPDRRSVIVTQDSVRQRFKELHFQGRAKDESRPRYLTSPSEMSLEPAPPTGAPEVISITPPTENLDTRLRSSSTLARRSPLEVSGATALDRGRWSCIDFNANKVSPTHLRTNTFSGMGADVKAQRFRGRVYSQPNLKLFEAASACNTPVLQPLSLQRSQLVIDPPSKPSSPASQTQEKDFSIPIIGLGRTEVDVPDVVQPRPRRGSLVKKKGGILDLLVKGRHEITDPDILARKRAKGRVADSSSEPDVQQERPQPPTGLRRCTPHYPWSSPYAPKGKLVRSPLKKGHAKSYSADIFNVKGEETPRSPKSPANDPVNFACDMSIESEPRRLNLPPVPKGKGSTDPAFVSLACPAKLSDQQPATPITNGGSTPSPLPGKHAQSQLTVSDTDTAPKQETVGDNTKFVSGSHKHVTIRVQGNKSTAVEGHPDADKESEEDEALLRASEHGIFCLEAAVECFNASWQAYMFNNEEYSDAPFAPLFTKKLKRRGNVDPLASPCSKDERRDSTSEATSPTAKESSPCRTVLTWYTDYSRVPLEYKDEMRLSMCTREVLHRLCENYDKGFREGLRRIQLLEVRWTDYWEKGTRKELIVSKDGDMLAWKEDGKWFGDWALDYKDAMAWLSAAALVDAPPPDGDPEELWLELTLKLRNTLAEANPKPVLSMPNTMVEMNREDLFTMRAFLQGQIYAMCLLPRQPPPVEPVYSLPSFTNGFGHPTVDGPTAAVSGGLALVGAVSALLSLWEDMVREVVGWMKSKERVVGLQYPESRAFIGVSGQEMVQWGEAHFAYHMVEEVFEMLRRRGVLQGVVRLKGDEFTVLGSNLWCLTEGAGCIQSPKPDGMREWGQNISRAVVSAVRVAGWCDSFNLVPFADITPEFLGPEELIHVEYYGYKLEAVITEPVSKLKAILLSNPDRVILSFRGTSNNTNMILDLTMCRMDSKAHEGGWKTWVNSMKNQVKKVKAGCFGLRPRVKHVCGKNGWCYHKLLGCKRTLLGEQAQCHTGFMNAWFELENAVKTAVAAVCPVDDPRPLYCTGHSLGGALAQIAAYYLKWKYYKLKKDVHVYGFACPRVGNLAFAAAYNAIVPNTFRVNIDGDPITSAPPSFMNACYNHAGRQLHLSRHAFSASWSIMPTWLDKGAFPSPIPSSHLMQNLGDRLNRILDHFDLHQLPRCLAVPVDESPEDARRSAPYQWPWIPVAGSVQMFSSMADLRAGSRLPKQESDQEKSGMLAVPVPIHIAVTEGTATEGPPNSPRNEESNGIHDDDCSSGATFVVSPMGDESSEGEATSTHEWSRNAPY